ncbi:extracellular solute-binding protein [Actinospica sp.]|uniref:extracellular solute-binding protein n=1 Tax=Actinospica sp. TaxID=1872142 RepID=UPI002CFEFA23|nr:extracellular solute-binding protein [Actinospica sp.]HWG28325.1 extracellular solute-binding protein [Actinospica sp.]
MHQRSLLHSSSHRGRGRSRSRNSGRRLALGAGLLALGLGAAACGASTAPAAASGAAKSGGTLTVWYMDGDLSARDQAAIDAAFTKATGAKVNVQIQEWSNTNTKLSTALAQNDPPDVLEIGNTDVPLFAATGALADLTADQTALEQGQSWLPGLAGPATVSGHLYAAPLFAGNRAVIYNKKLWSAAGIGTVPTSYAELTADLDKIKAANPAPDFSAFYFPGEYWYGALQFVWDAGGQLATDTGGTWSGSLFLAAAQQGLSTWKTFQNTYSTPASRDVDTKSPDQAALFAQGKAATILDSSVNTVLKDNPSLLGEIGTFPFPGRNPGSAQPVFLGGSDLAIAAKSANQSLALAYLKVVTSAAVRKADIVGIDGWTPVSTQLITQTADSLSDTSKAFAQAAVRSVATPATPGWATIESDSSINQFFASIATGGQSPRQAATSFDKRLDQALNAAQ